MPKCILSGQVKSSFTQEQADGRYVPLSRTINNKALSSNITLSASDVGAATEAYVDSRILVFTNQTVATSAFTSDSTYEDYPYRASIVLSGVTTNHMPEVTFALAEATSGNYAPVSETYDGGVYIYAQEVPESSITLPSIQCVYTGG